MTKQIVLPKRKRSMMHIRRSCMVCGDEVVMLLFYMQDGRLWQHPEDIIWMCSDCYEGYDNEKDR